MGLFSARFRAVIFQEVNNSLIWIGSKDVDVDKSTFTFRRHTYIISKEASAYQKGRTHYYFYEFGNDKAIQFKTAEKKDMVKSKVIDLIVKQKVAKQIAEGFTEKSTWSFIRAGILGAVLGALILYFILVIMGVVHIAF
jgi:hypothetical protein